MFHQTKRSATLCIRTTYMVIKELDNMDCWYCQTQLIWKSDFPYDEWYGEGEGIVTVLECPNCGAECVMSLRDDEDE